MERAQAKHKETKEEQNSQKDCTGVARSRDEGYRGRQTGKGTMKWGLKVRLGARERERDRDRRKG